MHKARLRRFNGSELARLSRNPRARRAAEHVLAPGEGAWDVCNLLGMSLHQLKALNKGAAGLFVGQVFRNLNRTVVGSLGWDAWCEQPKAPNKGGWLVGNTHIGCLGDWPAVGLPFQRARVRRARALRCFGWMCSALVASTQTHHPDTRFSSPRLPAVSSVLCKPPPPPFPAFPSRTLVAGCGAGVDLDKLQPGAKLHVLLPLSLDSFGSGPGTSTSSSGSDGAYAEQSSGGRGKTGGGGGPSPVRRTPAVAALMAAAASGEVPKDGLVAVKVRPGPRGGGEGARGRGGRGERGASGEGAGGPGSEMGIMCKGMELLHRDGASKACSTRSGHMA